MARKHQYELRDRARKPRAVILSRTVRYTCRLKEKDAKNIDKWTPEKLPMDQAMSGL
jgi:transcriptional regulator CBF1